MSRSGRDRDEAGRPRNARPRDALGRPLPYDIYAAPTQAPDLQECEAADFPTLLAGAQHLLDEGRPFHAHELLEAAWKRAPEEERPLWRALAQLAVGLTHLLRGNETGAKTVLTRSALELEAWEPAPYDIDAPGLAAAARRMARGTPEAISLRR